VTAAGRPKKLPAMSSFSHGWQEFISSRNCWRLQAAFVS